MAQSAIFGHAESSHTLYCLVFNGASDQEIIKKVKIGKFSFSDPVWSTISNEAKDFITKLLTLDQDKRPTAQQALEHPWI